MIIVPAGFADGLDRAVAEAVEGLPAGDVGCDGVAEGTGEALGVLACWVEPFPQPATSRHSTTASAGYAGKFTSKR
jgi:hypothetical protein